MIHWQANPLVRRLTDQTHWLSARRALWLAFGLGLVTLAWGTTVFLDNLTLLLVPFRYTPQPIFSPVDDIVGIIAFFLPLTIARVAAGYTARETNSESYSLVVLTSLSNADLVRGFIAAALYKARILMIVVVAFIPISILSGLYLNVSSDTLILTVQTELNGCINITGQVCTKDLRLEEAVAQANAAWVGDLAILAVGVARQCGMWLLAAALGVGLGIGFTRNVAATASPILMLIISLAFEGSAWSTRLLFATDTSGILIRIAGAALLAIFPFVFAYLLAKETRKSVRKIT